MTLPHTHEKTHYLSLSLLFGFDFASLHRILQDRIPSEESGYSIEMTTRKSVNKMADDSAPLITPEPEDKLMEDELVGSIPEVRVITFDN